MASISAYSASPFHFSNEFVQYPPKNSCTLTFKSSLIGSRSLSSPLTARTTPKSQPRSHGSSSSNRVMAASHSFDVVIVGAGIIGLTIARQFLIGSDLSVAVVDKAVPCSGATGAGQGYIWMAHKKPGSDIWDLAMRSHKLWQKLAESLRDQGLNPEELLGWKKTGSLLVGRTVEECTTLQQRVKELAGAGLRTEFLSSSDLFLKEPALSVENDTGAAYLPDDSQLDAHRSVAFIEKGNRRFGSEGRYAEFYHDPVTSLIRSNGSVAGVQTSNNTLYGKKATIVSAGCWSGTLMHELLKESNIQVEVPVKPRKGHLLVLENFDLFHVNHGLMEAGYVDHQSRAFRGDAASASGSASVDAGQMLSVSMTATTDSTGNLVLGSSREFSGFNTEVDESILNHIWKRAGEFFPKLREVSLEAYRQKREVRVGLRPYMPDGKPMIGPVPGLSNLFLATGHEGGGLSMALGTAELVVDMVVGNPLQVESSPYAVHRSC